MKRPILYILIFLILGIIVGQYTTTFVDIVLFVVISYVISFIIYKKFKFTLIMMLPIVLLLGIFLIKNNMIPINTKLESLADNNDYVEIYATVDSIGYTKTKKPKLTIETKYFKEDNKVINQKLKMQIILNKDDKVSVGQNILIKGELQHLNKQSNKGGYNELLYLKTRHIQYKMFPDYIKAGKTENSLKVFMHKSRERLSNVYDTLFDEKYSSILKAIIIGDKSNLDETIKELFSEAGIYHILAISGLHISLIAGMLIIIFDKIHKRYGKLAVILILVCYCIFTGGSVSTVRATIMVSVSLIGYLIHRTPDFLSSISTACIVLLVYQPLYLFDIGFQFSFAAVYGIAILVYPISRLIKNKKIADFASAYIAVNIVGKPIILYYFYTFSFIDVFVNMIVVPFVFIVVMFGIITGLVGLFSIKLAAFFAGPVYVVLKYYETICNFATSIPYSSVVLGRPSIVFIAICYVVIGIFAYMLYGDREQIIKRKKYFKLFLCIFALYVIIFNFIPKQLNVTMLDVGQGDCIVIDKGRKNYIIDGGGNIMKELGKDKDTGLNVLYPYLKYKGDGNIDAVFVTHTDEDHIKGIIEIIGRINIKKIYIPKAKFNDNMYEILIEEAQKYGVPIYGIKEGDKIVIDKNTYIECVYPFENMNVEFGKNNSSTVLRLNYKNISFLFTGDIEKEAENLILENNSDIKADILKLAHHGSNTSTQDEFLNKVSPKVAIVSSGKNNRYNHPSPETVEKLKENNIPMFNTANSGAITITTNGKKVKIKSMLGSEKYEAIKR